MTDLPSFFLGFGIAYLGMFLFHLIRRWSNRSDEKIIYQNIYGATGPKPWPSYGSTGPTHSGETGYNPIGYTGSTGPCKIYNGDGPKGEIGLSPYAKKQTTHGKKKTPTKKKA